MSNWYDDIDASTLQRIKTYSAFCDYKSQNLMLQTLYEAMQKKIDEYKQTNKEIAKDYADLRKQVEELKSIAEFQQSSNMTTHFENKKLKEGLAVGSTWNKALNSMNRTLEEERDKYRNMVFDKMDQLTKAKEIIEKLLDNLTAIDGEQIRELKVVREAEQFLKELENEKRL